jgi:hypothetical protein
MNRDENIEILSSHHTVSCLPPGFCHQLFSYFTPMPSSSVFLVSPASPFPPFPSQFSISSHPWLASGYLEMDGEIHRFCVGVHWWLNCVCRLPHKIIDSRIGTGQSQRRWTGPRAAECKTGASVNDGLRKSQRKGGKEWASPFLKKKWKWK